METNDLIPVNDFCRYHHITATFVMGLQEAGLVELTVLNEQPFLHRDHLRALERLVHLHAGLDINPEGVEAIAHLLQRMKELQQQMRLLEQRLHLYEQ